MIGIVIASHGRLAEEMLSTAQQIVGTFPKARWISISSQESVEDIQASMKSAVDAVDEGDGVLVFADLLGGTPCNQSLMLCQGRKMEVLTGVNLPMLVKAHSLRASLTDVTLLAEQLIQYGQKNIICASSMLRTKASGSPS